LLSDDEIRKDGNNRDYFRRQSLLDALTQIKLGAIYFVPLVMFIILILLIYHYIKINEYDKIEKIVSGLGGLVGGYIIRSLQSQNILPKD
jgi:hypothetical protein